jgi:hypothetical protein
MKTKLFFILIAGFAFSALSCNSDPDDTSNPADLSKESYFTESELNRITDLKDLLPEIVTTGFEAKYLEWKNTWMSVGPYSDSRKFAESEEYENALKYCAEYDKAILPLLFEKLHNPEEYYVVNLVRDMTTPEYYPHLYDECYRKAADRKIEFSGNAIWINYCKQVLAKEYENIKKSIQDIPIPRTVQLFIIYRGLHSNCCARPCEPAG